MGTSFALLEKKTLKQELHLSTFSSLKDKTWQDENEKRQSLALFRKYRALLRKRALELSALYAERYKVL